MARALALKKLYEKKHQELAFTGFWREIFGFPEPVGVWIFLGREKNGKTWFTLKVAEYLSRFDKVWYVSAEEGTDKTFTDACKRAKLDPMNLRLQFLEYLPIEDLDAKISARKAAKMIVIDNVTIYTDELKNGILRKFLKKHSDKLIMFIAHEERGEPDCATGKLIKKLAKIIGRVEGLACFITGRCPGGKLLIDETKAELYHGKE